MTTHHAQHPASSNDDAEPHDHGSPHAGHDHDGGLTRLSITATLHCMTGCVIGEVVGMSIATALGWSNVASIALAVSLAFVFGYALTSLPLLRAGLTLSAVIPLALATDTFSIATMELIDNATIALVPGAMHAHLSDPLYWAAMLGGFVVAFPFAFAVNRFLLKRGKGHALVHQYHSH